LDEAAATALSLEKELAQFTAAIARTEREIALIQEYRTRLTADVVTGKLDVREAAAKLPDSPVDHAQPEDADPGLEPDADDAEYSELEREN
jgi:type I restriction enzyme S subunit